jgi:hypothetical protein
VASDGIEQLTVLEQQWLQKQGGIEKDRAVAYEEAGVYAAWRDIFRQYVQLARHDLEALKRAIYLCWTQRSQDPQLSGVKNLDKRAIRQVLEAADELARTNGLDAELQWMLPYYHLVEPSYLDRFEGFDDLKQVSGLNLLLYRTECLKSSFENRGHMGRYWKSKQAILRQWP